MMTLSYENPVLVSDLPPLTEVINDKVNGYVFKSGDSENLSYKLNEILNEDSIRFMIDSLSLNVNVTFVAVACIKYICHLFCFQ